MAVDWTVKQKSFVQRYAAAVQSFMANCDALALLNAEFTANTYGTGGANAVTDVIVQQVVPSATAAQFSSAEGAVVTIMTTVNSNRGYLEALRT